MKIATIEKILSLSIHPTADKLDLARINGWQVCVKKGEFSVGDWCIYITVDSIVEDCPQYEFLRNKHFKIKTMKLRQQLSQGIAFPISLLESFGHTIPELTEGLDVAELIKCKHYEKPMSAQLAGTAKGMRPSYIKKTDEDNIKSNPGVISEITGKPYYISIKVDGCLDENTIIKTESGDMTIKDICESKYTGAVESYDVGTGEFKMSKIKNWFIQPPIDDWYEIQLESGKVLIATGNHYIWLPTLNCYRKVDDLTLNDVFLIKS